MMKRKKYLLMIIMMTFLIFMGNVKAAEEEEICKPTDLSNLRSMAANVRVTYVPVTETEKLDKPNFGTGATEIENNYLEIKIYNVNTKLQINVRAPGVDEIVTSADVGADGAITLRQVPKNEVVNYTFEIRSLEHGCYDHSLRILKLTLPRYNFYSQLGACADIPDYYMCQEYTTYKVDGATFYDKVAEYKNKLSSLEKEEDDDDNTGLVSQAFSNVSKYKYIIVGIVVVAGVLLTMFILKRRKSAL